MDGAEGLSERAGEAKEIQGPLRTPPGRCGARSSIVPRYLPLPPQISGVAAG